jgi:dihydropyrimidinase
MSAELIVRGGTVVTAGGRRQADVAVENGRISAIDDRLPESADAREVDAAGLLVLPGVIDVHTHTRIATDDEPDRFFQDSVAAAFGGTTTFLAFNNPGTGIEPSTSLMADAEQWKLKTAHDSAIDYAVSAVITSGQLDPVGELPAIIDAGIPTFKAFMVYDFGVDDSLLGDAMTIAGRHGGMLQVHCEDRVELETNTAQLLNAGLTAPRYHAASRPPYVEADGTRKAIAIARATGSPLYIVHLSCGAALAEVRTARADGLPVYAETCPHYLTLDESRYELRDELAAEYVISPPLRSVADKGVLWEGLADDALSLVATDHVPDRVAVEKQMSGQSFDRISNGGPGIETLLAVVYSQGVARGHITVERMVDLLSTTPARLFGLRDKGSIAVGKDADLVLFDPQERRTITQSELHHTSDYTPYEGIAAAGIVRSVLLRGEFVIKDGHFVGQRGFGKFQERSLERLV